MNHRGYYANVWPNWQAKVLGPQPTNEQLGTIHGLKARPGKQALANAMALRDGGVTGKQIKAAVSLFDGGANPQLNKMRSLVDAGMLAWVPMPPTADGKVYRTKLTALGQQMVRGNTGATIHVTPGLAAKATAKPVKAVAKAKGAPKPKAAPKVTPPAKPASEAPKPAQPVPHPVMTLDGPKSPQGEPVKA